MKKIKKIDFCKDFDFNNDFYYKVILNNEEIIITEFENYIGPITLQFLPNGGIQSLFHGLIIVKINNGFLAIKKLIYKNKNYNSDEFISLIGQDNLMNHILN